VEIIDACVSYIESLQDKLREHDPDLWLEGVLCDPEDTENNIVGDVVDGFQSKFVSLVRRNSGRRNQRRR
jgi:hypothetical protein